MLPKWAMRTLWVVAGIAVVVLLSRFLATGRAEPIIDQETGATTYEIVTLLPPDGIPSIDNPRFVSGEEADVIYHPDELVLGVEIGGDTRAYSIPFLSGHEIVNDVVAGEPVAVTW